MEKMKNAGFLTGARGERRREGLGEIKNAE
jgi:hypothetical protein